jgi:hypothetical protein
MLIQLNAANAALAWNIGGDSTEMRRRLGLQ